ASIKDRIPPFEVLFVGPGPTNWLSALVNKLGLDDQVIFLGKLQSGKAIIQFLDGLDFYVHPSKQEGLPRTVIEAMSRGLPILASSIAGIPELLDEPYLHQPGDYKGLAEQLVIYLNKGQEEHVAMSRSNYEKSKEYDHRLLAQKRLDFWRSFAAYARQIMSDPSVKPITNGH
ncbi:MAG: glycosyltransferase family 4 protein, partial [Bacteroidota bacterium]